MRRSFDDADQAPVSEFFGGDVGPVLAAVSGDMDESVVAPSPDEAFLEGRFSERENGVVVLDAGVVLCQRTARRFLLALVIARQVAADRSPGHSFVGGLKHRFSAVINGVGLVGGNHDRRGPLETVCQFRGP